MGQGPTRFPEPRVRRTETPRQGETGISSGRDLHGLPAGPHPQNGRGRGLNLRAGHGPHVVHAGPELGQARLSHTSRLRAGRGMGQLPGVRVHPSGRPGGGQLPHPDGPGKPPNGTRKEAAQDRHQGPRPGDRPGTHERHPGPGRVGVHGRGHPQNGRETGWRRPGPRPNPSGTASVRTT